ncbi:hypothetical protein HanXRQr2_Chr09g0408431 [Helianthus annuus]|uniref:Uncharacterized protein n=1 Tax=Helianthus annuus TaxID=4232 RepID=A0A9K3I902_HELAN|nr:hypothetical protein HanXRQr2_Chr09g0408431 [Helianthus annuus]KAJ0894925.1 hypothetical protein HanPSC8_Chr09g0394401 [Helianthus annuus]
MLFDTLSRPGILTVTFGFSTCNSCTIMYGLIFRHWDDSRTQEFNLISVRSMPFGYFSLIFRSNRDLFHRRAF